MSTSTLGLFLAFARARFPNCPGLFPVDAFLPSTRAQFHPEPRPTNTLPPCKHSLFPLRRDRHRKGEDSKLFCPPNNTPFQLHRHSFNLVRIHLNFCSLHFTMSASLIALLTSLALSSVVSGYNTITTAPSPTHTLAARQSGAQATETTSPLPLTE